LLSSAHAPRHVRRHPPSSTNFYHVLVFFSTYDPAQKLKPKCLVLVSYYSNTDISLDPIHTKECVAALASPYTLIF
jgi:hypothetical protein